MFKALANTVSKSARNRVSGSWEDGYSARRARKSSMRKTKMRTLLTRMINQST